MQKRIFLAISLPDDVKKRLFRIVEKEYKDLPVKWAKFENFHLTLNFLGYVCEENIPETCQSVLTAVQNFPSFEIDFQKIDTGPTREMKKMIWAIGEKNDELSELKYRLDQALDFLVREKREFRPHITLGRIRKAEWKRIFPRTTEGYDRLSVGRGGKSVVRGKPEPEIEREFRFSVPVSSIELYESRFEKGRRVYYVLESFSLK